MEAGHWPAIALLMVASIAWSIGSLYSQSVPSRLPLFSAAAVEMIAGALVLAAESRLMREDLGRFASASSPAWWALAYLAVFGSLVGFTAFAFCLNELPASTVGTYAYVNPVVAVLLGSLFLGEPVSAGGGCRPDPGRGGVDHDAPPRPPAAAGGGAARLLGSDLELIQEVLRAAAAEAGQLRLPSAGQPPG